MNIRLANNCDIPGMLELLRQVGQVHRDLRPDLFRDGAQKYDDNALAELLKDPMRPIFIAAEGDRVLGYCFCIRKECRDHPIFLDRTEFYIDDLCVDENARGQGIATALYRFVTDYARDTGCTHITLNVWCGNDSAQHFYEKMGMTQRNITMEMKLC